MKTQINVCINGQERTDEVEPPVGSTTQGRIWSIDKSILAFFVEFDSFVAPLQFNDPNPS